MLVKRICPKCGKVSEKTISKVEDNIDSCATCGEVFNPLTVDQKIKDYTEKDIDLIQSLSLRITPFGITLTESDYFKYINGGELNIGEPSNSRNILNDYITIKHTGTFEFVHYGPDDLNFLHPSVDPDGELSFGSGIYCYKADHKPVTIVEGTTLYKGSYTGDYLECMYDNDPSEKCDKGYGNTKEYLLKTRESIRVSKYKTN